MDMSLFTVEDREKVLKEYLELLENDYDYILIDCMPSLGMMTINALSEYSCAVTPQVRQTGNRLSGLAGTAYASLFT